MAYYDVLAGTCNLKSHPGVRIISVSTVVSYRPSLGGGSVRIRLRAAAASSKAQDTDEVSRLITCKTGTKKPLG